MQAAARKGGKGHTNGEFENGESIVWSYRGHAPANTPVPELPDNMKVARVRKTGRGRELTEVVHRKAAMLTRPVDLHHYR